MRKILFLLPTLLIVTWVAQAQNEYMYIMKDGAIVVKLNVNTELDSIIFYEPDIEDPNAGTFTDPRDGVKYNWVMIGDQIWMAENLKYLPSVVGPDTGSGTDPYYYVYGYNDTVVAQAKATANYKTYGVLYNWPAAMNGEVGSETNPSGVQGVCPTGWHLPSDAEWTELTDYLGGLDDAGGKLKEAGYKHWDDPNTGATNETGFTALPGGYRDYDGGFGAVGGVGYWWSATEIPTSDAWFRIISNDFRGVLRSNGYKELSFSVRCVKDN